MTGSGPILLLVEDDEDARQSLAGYLGRLGYRVDEAGSAHDALRTWDARRADLVVLDLGLPDLDGVDVIRRIRRVAFTPIVILSGRDQEGDKIRGLEAGADDYVTKPFAVGELLARMRVALRHAASTSQESGDSVVSVGGLRVDRLRRLVFVDEVEVRLTPIEYRLLSALARYPGRVLTHEHLLRQVWGPGYTHQHHYLRVYMAQLRHKLERDPSRPRYLITEPGVGYRLRED